MNIRYGISHQGTIYTYEARAWNKPVDLVDMWYTEVREWHNIDIDDGEYTGLRPVSTIVAPAQRINHHVDGVNPRQGIDKELRDNRNWARLAGKPLLFSTAHRYWFAAMAVPNINICGDPDTDALMMRVAARVGSPVNIRDLDEARKATTRHHHDDPDMLAMHITNIRQVAVDALNQG